MSQESKSTCRRRWAARTGCIAALAALCAIPAAQSQRTDMQDLTRPSAAAIADSRETAFRFVHGLETLVDGMAEHYFSALEQKGAGAVLPRLQLAYDLQRAHLSKAIELLDAMPPNAFPAMTLGLEASLASVESLMPIFGLEAAGRPGDRSLGGKAVTRPPTVEEWFGAQCKNQVTALCAFNACTAVLDVLTAFIDGFPDDIDVVAFGSGVNIPNPLRIAGLIALEIGKGVCNGARCAFNVDFVVYCGPFMQE
ncbi:MAG: hypothetical protein V3T72_06595, partial [Thermoanaerobaculia bacterium]